MRRSLLETVVVVGVAAGALGGGGPIVSVAEAEVAVARAPDRFPLPKDAASQTDKMSKKASSRITTYDVPRSRDAVVTEARAALKTGKWEVVKDAPSGNAVRLTVKKNGKTWKASFTGDDKQAVIIVTAPT